MMVRALGVLGVGLVQGLSFRSSGSDKDKLLIEGVGFRV